MYSSADGDLPDTIAIAESIVAAVVPVFLPPLTLPLLVAELRSQCQWVVLVVDGPDADPLGVCSGLGDEYVSVIANPVNLGIAAAINVGTHHFSTRQSVDYILTVDQDSRLPAHYVAEAVKLVATSRQVGVSVGAVSAGVINAWSVPTTALNGVPVTKEPLQSGMLLDSALLTKIGGLDEGLFIDGVDEDVAMRLHVLGYSVATSSQLTIEHSLGEGHRLPMWLGGGPFSYHGPTRRYYITRNRAILSSRYVRSAPLWVAKKIAKETKQFLICLAFGPERVNQLRAFVRGLGDAAIGRRGRAHA